MAILLSARELTVSFHKPVLQGLDLDIEDQGILNLMGPCGVGKSTLLRTLSGANDNLASCTVSGQVYYGGEPIGLHGWPKLVEQKPPQLLHPLLEYMVGELPERENLTKSQQRALVESYFDAMGYGALTEKLAESVSLLPAEERIVASILAAALGAPPLLLIDEPTSGLEDDAAARVLALIKTLGRKHSVVVVLHNQRHARELEGTTALLAGGRIHEIAPTATFFTSPTTAAGADFARTGSCAVPSPGAADDTLDPEQVARHAGSATAKAAPAEIIPFGPSGFRWIERNALAACPRPGLLGELDADLAALRKVGITHVVSLEELEQIPAGHAAAYDLQVLWHPIADMNAPTRAGALDVVHWIAAAIDRGGRVVVHCKGGLGRTGTIIAAYLVHRGATVDEAVRVTRSCDPRMIQSRVQENFLESFSEWLGDGASVATTPRP